MAQERPGIVRKMVLPASQRTSTAESLTAKDVFIVLRRHLFLIFFLTVIGLAAGIGTWKLLQKYFPRYTATTYIQVLSPVTTDPLTIGEAQVENTLQYNFRRSIANLIKQQSTLQKLIERDKVQETEWYRNLDESELKAVKSLKKNFIANPHRDSDFVEISMSCGKAEESALIVNEMLELFLAKQQATETEEVSNRLIQLEEQKDSIEHDLQTAEDNLEDVRRQSGITDLDTAAGRNYEDTVTLRLNTLELQKDEIELTIGQYLTDINNLEQLATDPISEQIEVELEKDTVLLNLSQQLISQQAILESQLVSLGENHRDVLRTKEAIEKIKEEKDIRRAEVAEQIRQSRLKDAEDALVILQGQLAGLEEKVAEAEAQKTERDLARVEYDRVLQIRNERLEMLEEIKKNIEQWKIIAEDPETPKVQAVGLAPEPLEMVFSRKPWLWIPSGIMLGFMLGIGLAFLLELSNDLVRTPSDVASLLGVPLLGIIPDAAEDNQVRKSELSRVVCKAPYSMISESYRQCCANLRLTSSAESVKTLLVSSGMASDGKTSTAINLAAAFATAEKNVLLIDANFRKPSLNKLFPKVATKGTKARVKSFDLGLSSVLTHQCKTIEVIRPSGIEGFDVIDCGPIPANPAELLGSSIAEEMLAELRRKYDYIIIDGPPVLLVSDAKVLAGMVDAVLLVFNASATSRGAAQRSVRELRHTNANIIGSVLFAAKAMKGGYFSEQFRSFRKYQKVIRRARKRA